MASPFCFRPSPELAAVIDASAKSVGLSRAQWLLQAAQEKLRQHEREDEEIREEVAQIAPPASGSARADAFRAMRRLGR